MKNLIKIITVNFKVISDTTTNKIRYVLFSHNGNNYLYSQSTIGYVLSRVEDDYVICATNNENKMAKIINEIKK